MVKLSLQVVADSVPVAPAPAGPAPAGAGLDAAWPQPTHAKRTNARVRVTSRTRQDFDAVHDRVLGQRGECNDDASARVGDDVRFLDVCFVLRAGAGDDV